MDRVIGCIVRACLTLVIALAVVEPGSAVAAVAKIYWAGEDRIQRADPDGGNIEDFVVGNDFNSLRAIALDAIGGKMYWATIRLSFNCCNFLWRANLDGTAVEQLPVDVVNGLSIGDITLDPVGGKIYWTQGGLYRANLDGTVVENIVPDSGHIAAGIDIDSMHRKIYWVNASSASIQRANLDGSTVETLVTLSFNGLGLSDRPRGITLDVQGGKMYFTHLGFGDGRNQGIGRADLDGGHGESLYVDGVVPLPITLDVEEGKMYWGELGGSIKRANLDGTAVETIVMPSIPPIGIALLLQEKDQITAIHPRAGGDTGSVTMRIFGSGFAEGAAVKLTRNGESEIVGTPIAVGERGTIITTTFELAGKVRGVWDVVVTNPDGISIILSEGFTIEEGRAAQVWVDIVGLQLFRPGRAQTFWINYGNRGNVNAIGVPLWIAGIPKNATFTLNFDITPPPVLPGQESIDWDQIPVHVETDEGIVVPLIIPQIPPGYTGSLGITLDIPATAGPLRLQAWTNPPLFSSPLSEEFVDCILDIMAIVITPIPVAGCVFSVAQPLLNLFITGENVLSKGPQSTLRWLTSVVRGCVPGLGTISDAASLAAFVVNTTLRVTNPISSCSAAFHQSASSDLSAQPVASFDPNDKIGSQGAGVPRFLSGSEPLRYAIFFENLETATAPAQEVIITDRLDVAHMDLSTLSLGPITFGDNLVTPPPGLSTFATDVDLRPAKDLIVRITASLNPATGLLTWRLTSIDPATGELPEDLLAGFLPPNIHSPEGSGSVLFTVMPKAGLPTGTEIRNQAEIIFDVNEPIVTPEWLNILDNTKPTSQVAQLAATQNTASFAVQWTGNDAGVGIKDYTIFVSENESPFAVWLRDIPDTSGTFSGENGKTYAFYSVARDQTGNLEEAPGAPDTTTQVVGSQELLSRKDSFLRDGADNTNEGANPLLRLQAAGHNRVIVAFDLSGIDLAQVTSATLILTIVENADNWGRNNDRTVEAHPLLVDFTEGNGQSAGVPGATATRGNGPGVTWACATDSEIANQRVDCTPRWNGGTFGPATALPVVHVNGQRGEVQWDVTADVVAGATGWVIKKTNEGQSGQVAYASKEGTAPPRLILTLE